VKLSYILFIFILPVMAQDQVEEVTVDVVKVLENGVKLNPSLKCGDEEKVGLVIPNNYKCDCEHKNQHEENDPVIEVIPKNHLLHKKYGLKLIKLDTSIRMVNDNNLLSLFDYNIGDDRGNTFGNDIGTTATLLDKNNNKIKIGVNYNLRQYSLPVAGTTYLDFDTGAVDVYGKKEDGYNYNFYQTIREGLEEEYGDRDYLNNQSSMTMQMLEVDLMIEPPKEKNQLGLSYGIGIGYRDLNDDGDQLGANLQDWWHKQMNIYRFEWKTFSNLIIGGRESYLTFRPKARVDFPTLEFGKCRLKSNAEFSVLFNTPIRNTTENQTLSIVEPKVSANFTLGLIPLKGDLDKSVIEWNNNLTYDPLNKVPANLDPGNKGFANTNLQVNFNAGKKIQFYVVPIEFYIPLGKQDPNNILSGGDPNDQYIEVKGQRIKKETLTNDIIGSWGRVGVVFKLDGKKRKRPSE
jgi:hypothetical protein